MHRWQPLASLAGPLADLDGTPAQLVDDGETGFVGEVVADMMTGRTPFVDVSPLSKDRFAATGLRKELNIV